jgi:NADH-quinone oxidoreductase subunit C
MMGTAEEVAHRFAAALDVGPEVIGEDVAGTAGVVVPAERWHEALAFARDTLGLDFFDWLSAVDETDREPAGFDVVVHLVRAPVPERMEAEAEAETEAEADGEGERSSGGGLDRLLIRTRVAEGRSLPSVTDLWPGAAWHERETFEMFGVPFDGFDDGTGLGLRPLLLPEGFEGTPLRKSFVLAARVSKPWPGAKEPGESDARPASPGRRRLLPPGVPDPAWGPRPPVGGATDE